MNWKPGDLAIMDHPRIRPEMRGRIVKIETLDCHLPIEWTLYVARQFPGQRVHGVVDVLTDIGYATMESSLHPIQDPDQTEQRQTERCVEA